MCDCRCLIYTKDELYKNNGSLSKTDAIGQFPEIMDLANSDLLIGDGLTQGILGFDCYTDLCADIAQATQQASDYLINNPLATNSNPMANRRYYMQPKWLQLIDNQFLKQTFEYYTLYLYYKFYGASTPSLDGLVKTERVANENDAAGSKMQDADKTAAMANRMAALAQSSLKLFNNTFWNKAKTQYNCFPAPNDCNTCNEHKVENKPRPPKMWVQ